MLDTDIDYQLSFVIVIGVDLQSEHLDLVLSAEDDSDCLVFLMEEAGSQPVQSLVACGQRWREILLSQQRDIKSTYSHEPFVLLQYLDSI